MSAVPNTRNPMIVGERLDRNSEVLAGEDVIGGGLLKGGFGAAEWSKPGRSANSG